MSFKILLAAAVLWAAAPTLAAELVSNGGFESGSLAGFTVAGSTGTNLVNFISAKNGGFGASFSPAVPGSISQDLVTVAGYSYTVSYWLSHTTSNTPLNAFSASFGTNGLQSLTNAGRFGFTQFSFTTVATSTLTRLQFNFQDTRTSVYRIDGISVTTVPEPETWGLMVVGFVAAGVTLRRRNRVAA